MTSNNHLIVDSLQELYEQNKVFCFYRKKESQKVNVLIQKDLKLHKTKLFNESGFVMSPFQQKENNVFIPKEKSASITYSLAPEQISITNIDEHLNKNVKPDEPYINLLQKTIDYIKDKHAQKIVLSRPIYKNLYHIKMGQVFLKVLNHFPTAFVYFFHHPKVGTWMGATPEQILNLKNNNFHTVALAGTQLFNEKVVWEQKEKDEQQFVTDFIVDQLLPISDYLNISTPYTIRSGHLAHLKTDIEGEIKSGIDHIELIKRLHPTPAVCGTPRKTAQDFILKYETYNRNFYTGFVGEIQSKNELDLYVNLRCTQFIDDKALIYVGGGVTKDSDPLNEWTETVEKSKTLGQFL